MKTRAILLPLILCLGTLLSGCKLAIMVTSGGTVDATNNAYDCTGPGLCEIDITTAPFHGSFRAVPKPGYVFVKWQAGDGFHCGNSTNPKCDVSIPAGALGDAIVAAFETGYLMPLFKDVGVDTDGDGVSDRNDPDDDNDGVLDQDDRCPLYPYPDCAPIVGLPVGSRLWAQPKLFLNVTSTEIKSVCPGSNGRCTANSVLKGQLMTGWTWANVDDVNAMMNDMYDTNVMGPGPTTKTLLGNFYDWSWPPAGWQITGYYQDFYYGQWIKGLVNRPPPLIQCGAARLDFYGPNISGDTGELVSCSAAGEGRTGAWFYRDP